MEKLKSGLLFETPAQNRYLYDSNIKSTTLCHPLFHHILTLDDNGVDIKSWFNDIKTKGEPLEIKDIDTFAIQDIEYYVHKFLLFKANGYLTETGQQEKLGCRVEPEVVETALANVEQLIFEVTEDCNLKCKYCTFGEFYVEDPNRKSKTPDIDAALKLLDFLEERWNSNHNRFLKKEIRVGFYGGEPLLNIEFIEKIIDRVNSIDLKNRGQFIFIMTTNGVLVKKYMDFLVKHDFHLIISLDGNEAHNTHRVFKNGKPAFPAIMESINALKERYPDFFKDNTSFISVLHDKNSVSEVYDFFEKQFDKQPNITSLNNDGIDESQKEAFLNTYKNFTEHLLQAENYNEIEEKNFVRLPNIQNINTFLNNGNHFIFLNLKGLKRSKGESTRYPTSTCIPFAGKTFMTAKGTLLACEAIDHKYVLGTVSPDKVNVDYKAVAAQYNAWYDHVVKQCHTCYGADQCKWCIFNLDLTENGPSCPGYQGPDEFSRDLAIQMEFFEKKPWYYRKLLKGAEHV